MSDLIKDNNNVPSKNGKDHLSNNTPYMYLHYVVDTTAVSLSYLFIYTGNSYIDETDHYIEAPYLEWSSHR